MIAISNPTRQRLISLVRLLEQLENTGKTKVSSAEIQNRTGWNRDTVRRDILALQANCGSAQGYEINALKQAIRKALNLNNAEKKCCIVGLGELGAALARHGSMEGSAFVVCAGFDSNVNRTETLVMPFALYPAIRMEQVISSEHIEYAILATDEKEARPMALRLYACGIRGIVNCTGTVLPSYGNVAVHNLSVLDALQNIASSQHNVIEEN